MALWLPVIGLQANLVSMLVCVWPLALLVRRSRARPERPPRADSQLCSLPRSQIGIWCVLFLIRLLVRLLTLVNKQVHRACARPAVLRPLPRRWVFVLVFLHSQRASAEPGSYFVFAVMSSFYMYFNVVGARMSCAES